MGQTRTLFLYNVLSTVLSSLAAHKFIKFFWVGLSLIYLGGYYKVHSYQICTNRSCVYSPLPSLPSLALESWFFRAVCFRLV